jgi:hypothetical protein
MMLDERHDILDKLHRIWSSAGAQQKREKNQFSHGLPWTGFGGTRSKVVSGATGVNRYSFNCEYRSFTWNVEKC